MNRSSLAPLAILFGAGLALSTAASASERLLLDDASVQELLALEHVDERIASAIVGLRAERGHLNSVEELRIIPGVREETLASLRRSTEVEVQLTTGAKKSYGSVDEVLAEFAGEPSVQNVQDWASDYARVNPHIVDSWMGASRAFAVLPRVQVEYRVRDGWDQKFRYYPDDGQIDTPDDHVFSMLDGAARDQDRYYTVRGSWDLDKLIMSSERIRVINEAQDIVKLRDKVLSEVTRIYFERRRVQVDMLLSPKRDIQGQIKDELRLMELTANLDALTGGRLSAAVTRR